MTPTIQTTPAPNRTCAVTSNVAEIAQERLRESPYRALRSVECRFHEGVLILTGDVPTFYTKQIAQTVVQNLHQVELVDNRLTVDY